MMNAHKTVTLPHGHDERVHSLLQSLPDVECLQPAADAMKILSDPVRMQLFWLLCHCEECVADLAAMVNMSSPAISHHLRILKETGLVETRREGKEMRYHAKDTPLVTSLHRIVEEIVHITCPMN